ncbi:peptidylprolyl isomerase [bacterium]|nr:peptidylprolyl isomerase [bacterium]|tara:strand:- start:206 stop:859 length:654 start_codon:yes stop_codon:yes gene_type:complete
MIKKVKASLSEKILFLFLISLASFAFISFFLLKNKCFFVKNIYPDKINFPNPANIAVMNVECGNVIVELYPNISPKSVDRFKTIVKKGSYNGSAFYRVIENTLVHAGDLEFGNINNLNYPKIGSGKSGLGLLNSELSEDFQFTEGIVALARGDKFNTEDSEFFIILKEIPLYQNEYTPIGKVIYGLDALKKIKVGNYSQYVLDPDYINYVKLLEQYN